MSTRAKLARLEREVVVAVLSDDYNNRIEVKGYPRGRKRAQPTIIHVGGLDLQRDI